MSHGSRRKHKNKKLQGESLHKTNWCEVAFPILIGLGGPLLITNTDSPAVVVSAWIAMAVAALWFTLRTWPAIPLGWWKKGVIVLIGASALAWLGYSNMRDRLRPSYVFLIPGVWVLDGRWDLIVNHRGEKTSYNVQSLFVDEDRLDFLKHSKQALSPADMDSYQTILSIPEVNPKGRGSVFAKQFIWRPFSPNNSHFTIEITWRDGSVHEDIRIARVQDGWAYAMSVSNKETGKHLFDCKDARFPSRDVLPACFPGTVSSD